MTCFTCKITGDKKCDGSCGLCFDCPGGKKSFRCPSCGDLKVMASWTFMDVLCCGQINRVAGVSND